MIRLGIQALDFAGSRLPSIVHTRSTPVRLNTNRNTLSVNIQIRLAAIRTFLLCVIKDGKKVNMPRERGTPKLQEKPLSERGWFFVSYYSIAQILFFPASIPPDNRVNAAALDLSHEYGHHFAFQKRTLAKTSANVTDVAQQPGVARFQI